MIDERTLSADVYAAIAKAYDRECDIEDAADAVLEIIEADRQSRGEPVLVGWAVSTTGRGMLPASRYTEVEARRAGYSLPVYRLTSPQPAEPQECGCCGRSDGCDPDCDAVQPAEPLKVPSDGDIMVEWASTPNTGDMRVDLVVFARALLDRYGQQAQPSAIPVGIAAPAGPMYPPGKTLALFDGSQVPPGERLYTAPIDPANDNPTPEEEEAWQRLERRS